MVQWLGLGVFTAEAQVPSLVGELRSLKPCSTTKKQKNNKKREGDADNSTSLMGSSWGLNERIQVGQESGVWHTVSARQASWYLSPTLQHHCACNHNVCHPHPSLLPCPLPPRPALCSHAPASPQILWTFSIYLESVAILPQLFMVSKTGEAETITSHYLFALGVYRTLYLFNWIWRYHFEGFFDLIAIVAGLVQTVLYCDFFYLYITKGSQRGGPAGREPAPSPAPTLPGAPASSPQPCIPRGKIGQREGQGWPLTFPLLECVLSPPPAPSFQIQSLSVSHP